VRQGRTVIETYEAECPTCLCWFPAAGPEGLLPHVLADHSESPLARHVDDLLLEAIFEQGIEVPANRPTPEKGADGGTVWDFP
jgi:hypothetical protein